MTPTAVRLPQESSLGLPGWLLKVGKHAESHPFLPRSRPRGEATLMASLMPYVLVAAGGALGTLARFILSRWVGVLVDTRFPLGTFVVNVSGSFLLGVIGTIVADRVVPNSDTIRLALGVGFLGAFTTFSTFEFETHALVEDGSWLTALTNMFLSLFLGLLAVRAGIVTARSWLA